MHFGNVTAECHKMYFLQMKWAILGNLVQERSNAYNFASQIKCAAYYSNFNENNTTRMFWIGTLHSLSTQVHYAPDFYLECATFKSQSENKLFWCFIIVFPIPPRKMEKYSNIPQSLPSTHTDHPTIILHSVPYWQHHKKITPKKVYQYCYVT